MAKFSDLPKEIILAILHFVYPNDIESFVMTTKSIYELFTAAYKEHNELKQKYSAFYDLSSGGFMSFIELLGVVVDNRKIGHYIKEVVIAEWSQGWAERGEHPPPYDGAQMARVRDAVYEVHRKYAEGILDEIECGDEEPMIAMLLLLLPNLETINWCPNDDYQTSWLKVFLNEIATYKGPKAPLRRLNTVRISNEVDNTESLNMIALFACLPALQKLHAFDIYQVHYDHSHPRSQGVKRSNVTELIFSNVSIYSKSLFEFLSSFGALQTFSWDGPCPRAHPALPVDISDQDLFDPYWIRAALLAYAKETLQSLTILSRSAEQRWMGDLRGFRRLKYVRTEIQLLYNLDHMISLRAISRAQRTEESVANILPAATQHLSLQVSRETESEPALPLLLFAWSSEKQRLSGLRTITLLTERRVVLGADWTMPEAFEELRQRFGACNVRFTVATSHS